MFALIARRRLLLAGALAAATAGGVGGTVLAAHSSSSTPASIASTKAETPSNSSGTASTGVGTEKHLGKWSGAGGPKSGKVLSVTTTSITILDAGNQQTTFQVLPKTKVVTWNHQPKDVATIPVGEIVVVVGGHHRDKGSTAPPQPTDALIAAVIEDTGFKAA
jgi:hypothetical protein